MFRHCSSHEPFWSDWIWNVKRTNFSDRFWKSNMWINWNKYSYQLSRRFRYASRQKIWDSHLRWTNRLHKIKQQRRLKRWQNQFVRHNQILDPTEEIKTFTRKETNQYRVLSMSENAPIFEQSSWKFENSSKVNFIVIWLFFYGQFTYLLKKKTISLGALLWSLNSQLNAIPTLT